MRKSILHRKLTRAERTSNFERALKIGAQFSAILVGIVALAFILDRGQLILAPVILAIVIGLMFGPVAGKLERFGIPPALSALFVVISFLVLIMIAMATIVIPLSGWMDRLPIIWIRAQTAFADWREALSSLDKISESVQGALGSDDNKPSVKVDEGQSAVENVVWLAPAIAAQIVLFLASLYFFMATRSDLRLSVLSLCFDRRLRWRVAHIFRDIERLVSRYLLSITAINAVLGIAVSAAMAFLGVPSPILWGVLAGLLNYIIYIGPAVMVVVLLGVGLATSSTPSGYLAPMLTYLALNMLEAQIITPHVLGRTLTLNPFIVLLALAFWITIWGPVGGLIALPMLLMVVALIRHISPENHRRVVKEANEENVEAESA